MIKDVVSIVDTDAPAHKAQRVPIELFKFSHPLLPARAFSFARPVEQTNKESYCIVFDDREIPFKVLRHPARLAVSRPVFVLFHGMGLHIASFWGIAGHLLPDCDLVLIDYNSFAGRGWPQGGPSIRMLMHAAMRIPKELGLSRIHIGGSSLGGGIGLMAGLDYPQLVDSLVLFNPAIFPQELPHLYNTIRVPIQGEVFMTAIPPEHLAKGVASLGYVDPERLDHQLMDIYKLNMSSIENRFKLMDIIRQLPVHYVEAERYLARAHLLTQPVLIIWGRQDNLLDRHAGDHLLQTMSNVDFRDFPDLAHLPHEEDPDRIGPIVAKFIARQKSRN